MALTCRINLNLKNICCLSCCSMGASVHGKKDLSELGNSTYLSIAGIGMLHGKPISQSLFIFTHTYVYIHMYKNKPIPEA